MSVIINARDLDLTAFSVFLLRPIGGRIAAREREAVSPGQVYFFNPSTGFPFTN